MADTYPVLSSPRPLVPGAAMVLRADAGGMRAGHRLLVAFRSLSPDEEPRRVGTVGLVWGIDRADEGPDRVQVRGEVLVRIERRLANGSADVSGLETGRPPDPALLEDVQRLLRRYMAASAEAGEGGDVGVTLSADPVIASHQVASLVRVSAPELQEVLEAGDAPDRLQRLADILRRETGLLRSTMGGRGA